MEALRRKRHGKSPLVGRWAHNIIRRQDSRLLIMLRAIHRVADAALYAPRQSRYTHMRVQSVVEQRYLHSEHTNSVIRLVGLSLWTFVHFCDKFIRNMVSTKMADVPNVGHSVAAMRQYNVSNPFHDYSIFKFLKIKSRPDFPRLSRLHDAFLIHTLAKSATSGTRLYPHTLGVSTHALARSATVL